MGTAVAGEVAAAVGVTGGVDWRAEGRHAAAEGVGVAG